MREASEGRVVFVLAKILDRSSSRCDQMEALFLNSLQRPRPRLSECPLVMFAMDALDECTSETEIADLISLLARWGQSVVNLFQLEV